MKRFVIRYSHHPESGSVEEWHAHIEAFIGALSADPELGPKITYRCMKAKGGNDYYHFVEATDDAPDILSQRDWFKKYTEQTRTAGGGTVQVIALDTIAETNRPR